MADQQFERLRRHPTLRFAGAQHQFNLDEVAIKLERELEAGESGHRQESLYKRGSTSVSLFLFGHFTRMAPHRVKGAVTIHVLKGHLQVTAEDSAHDLRAGDLLVLASGVEHGVVAREESRMLLTVNLDTAPVP